ncbi:hypothetical protein PG990_013431 [Apiospora arundinis]|uniref:Uncharacterized protein n=1 Tax=Apiospora arundinis TaxID=335852 RepID=A0ABR2IBL3_9PEZI
MEEEMERIRESNDELGPILEREKEQVDAKVKRAREVKGKMDEVVKASKGHVNALEATRNKIYNLKEGGFDVDQVRDRANRMTQRKLEGYLHVIFGRLGDAHLNDFIEGISGENQGLLLDLFKRGTDDDLKDRIRALEEEKEETRKQHESRVKNFQNQLADSSMLRSKYFDDANALRAQVSKLTAAATTKNDKHEGLERRIRELEAEKDVLEATSKRNRDKVSDRELRRRKHEKAEREAKRNAESWRNA